YSKHVARSTPSRFRCVSHRSSGAPELARWPVLRRGGGLQLEQVEVGLVVRPGLNQPPSGGAESLEDGYHVPLRIGAISRYAAFRAERERPQKQHPRIRVGKQRSVLALATGEL